MSEFTETLRRWVREPQAPGPQADVTALPASPQKGVPPGGNSVARAIRENIQYLGDPKSLQTMGADAPSSRQVFNNIADLVRVGVPLGVGVFTANPLAAFAAGVVTESAVDSTGRALGYGNDEDIWQRLQRITRAGVGEAVGQGLGNIAGKATQVVVPRNVVRASVRSEIRARDAFNATHAVSDLYPQTTEGKLGATLLGQQSEAALPTSEELLRRQSLIEQGGFRPTLEMRTGSVIAGDLERLLANDTASAVNFNQLANYNAGKLAERRDAALNAVGPEWSTTYMGERALKLYDKSTHLANEAKRAATDFDNTIKQVYDKKISRWAANTKLDAAEKRYVENKIASMKARGEANFEETFGDFEDFGFTTKSIENFLQQQQQVTPLRLRALSKVKTEAGNILATLREETAARGQLPGGQEFPYRRALSAREFQESMSEIGRAVPYPGEVLGDNVSPGREKRFSNGLFGAIMDDFNENIARAERQGINAGSFKRARDAWRDDMTEINAFKDYVRDRALSAATPVNVVRKLSKEWEPEEIKGFVKFMGSAAPQETAAIRSAAMRDIFSGAYDISPTTGRPVLNPRKFSATYGAESKRLKALSGPEIAPMLDKVNSKMLMIANAQKANKSQIYLKKPIEDIVDSMLSDGSPDRIRNAIHDLNAKDVPLASAIQRRFVQKLLAKTDVAGEIGLVSGAKLSSTLASGKNRELLDAVLLSDDVKLRDLDRLQQQALFIKRSESKTSISKTQPLIQLQDLISLVNILTGNPQRAAKRATDFMSNKSIANMISTPRGIEAVLGVLPLPKKRASFVNAALNYTDLWAELGVLRESNEAQESPARQGP